MKTMLNEYKTQAILGVWGGIVFALLGYFLFTRPEAMYFHFGRLMIAGGYILLACGSFMYARGKGYSWYVGILGAMPVLGLLVLYCMRDKSRMVLKKRIRTSL